MHSISYNHIDLIFRLFFRASSNISTHMICPLLFMVNLSLACQLPNRRSVYIETANQYLFKKKATTKSFNYLPSEIYKIDMFRNLKNQNSFAPCHTIIRYILILYFLRSSFFQNVLKKIMLEPIKNIR